MPAQDRAKAERFHAIIEATAQPPRRELGTGCSRTYAKDGKVVTTVVLTNRGLTDEESRSSHREGWLASFDNLERVPAK